MKILRRINFWTQKALMLLAGIVLVGMIAMTCVNIVGRRFDMPVKGVFELMGFGCAMLIGFSMAYTQQQKENISVDIIVNYFPRRVKKVVSVLNDVICLGLSGIACYKIFDIGLVQMNSGELTETLRIVVYPFTMATAAGFVALCMVFICDLLENVWPVSEQKI